MIETLLTSMGETSSLNITGNSNQSISLNLTDSINSGTSASLSIPHFVSLNWDGGSTSHAFTIAGIVSSVLATVTLSAQSNAAYIVSYSITSNTITVVFSADPGVGTKIVCSWVPSAQ